MLAERIEEIRAALAEGESQLERVEAAMRAAAQKFSDAEKYVERLRIELDVLQQADRLRPPSSQAVIASADATDNSVRPRRRGGRQPGSIAKKWRLALSDLVAAGNRPIDMDQFYLLTRGRLGLTESSARERVKSYATQGILTEEAGFYRVSDYAIQRFGLGVGSGRHNTSGSTIEITYPRDGGVADNEKAPH